MTSSDPSAPEAVRKRIFPPYSVRQEFLAPALVAELLAYAEANQARFAAAPVYRDGKTQVQNTTRVSSLLHDFEPLQARFLAAVAPLAPEIAAALRVKPFAVSRVELELAAHGDGAFFSRHIDTLRHAEGVLAKSVRLLSGVYYFHATPKGFEGGALRLHELTNDPGAQFVDLEPVHNSLVFFPSWMPHEVLPVRCASRRFADSRFAINCWFHRAAQPRQADRAP